MLSFDRDQEDDIADFDCEYIHKIGCSAVHCSAACPYSQSLLFRSFFDEEIDLSMNFDEDSFDGWEDLDFERFHSTDEDDEALLFLEDDPETEYQPIDLSQASETLNFLIERMQPFYDLRALNIDPKGIPDLLEEMLEHVSGGTPEQYQDLKDFAQSELGYTVSEAEMLDGRHGVANSLDKYIVVDSNLNLSNKIRVLSHEIGHAMLHSHVDLKSKSMSVEEIEAESVAMIMSEHFGIEAGACSELYISFWMKRTFLFDSPEHLFSTVEEDVGTACNRIRYVIGMEQEDD